jgi:hypothetical protein
LDAPSPSTPDGGSDATLADVRSEAPDAASDGAATVDASPGPPDTQPPTFAGIASAGSPTASSITLAWSPASDDVSSPSEITYLVYMATTSHGEDFTQPTYTQTGGAALVADDLAPTTPYFFVVRAQDAAGNTDANTTEVSATTTVPRFAEDVLPLFLALCAGRCHAQPDPVGELDLGDASVAYPALVDGASDQCATMVEVSPGSPGQSYLMQKLVGQGSCFIGDQMPRNKPPLDANQMSVVTGWIARGAPND